MLVCRVRAVAQLYCAGLLLLSNVAFASEIRLPDGFRLSVYADTVPGARQMASGNDGTVFVGTRRQGRVYALVDSDGDFRADQRFVVANGLRLPTGVAFRNGSLYVAALDRILRFDRIEQRLKEPPLPVIVIDNLPSETHHGSRYIAFGPDGFLYLSVGAPCNVCQSADPRFGTILRVDVANATTEIFAEGVRNSVGFDWHPVSNAMWFTDNGRDWLGDDLPPDELNVAGGPGGHYGFPFVYGNNQKDPDFGGLAKGAYVAPTLTLQAHSAPLGVLFYTGEMFPKEYRNSLFVAQHGSWNRSRKVGYQVLNVQFDGDKGVSARLFASGWLSGQRVSGRPVAFLQLPDGSVLLSDDHANVIYRIDYSKN